MLLTHLKDLYAHMQWADAAVWRAVSESEDARADDDTLDLLMHIHETQFAFVDHWMQRPFVRKSREDFDSPADICRWARGVHEAIPGYLESIRKPDLDQSSVVPWAKYVARGLGREIEPTTLLETLHQLVSHSMHHRGQVVRRLRELGLEPPMTDYIAWVWTDRPEPEWPDN